MWTLDITLICLMLMAAASAVQASAPGNILVPPMPGFDVTVGETAIIPGATNNIAFRFRDGRIVVRGGDQDIWSSDGGRTWTPGPRGPLSSKTALDLGGGEILSFASSTDEGPNGVHELGVVRSTDNWATQKAEKALVTIPLAGACRGDDGKAHAGMIVHHGALRLKNGDLMVTLYGNYQGDTELADAYPVEFNCRKYRTVVMTSSDKGRTWGNPLTVAYNTMLARGLDTDSHVVSYRVVPAVTQEGFCEPDLTRAPNGDMICMMRSGGRLAVGNVPIFPTPMYISRSSDEGKTWSPPVQVMDRGVCPYLVTLDNGVIVCSYSRPDQWLIFSDDNGVTWKGPIQVTTGDSYLKVLAAGPDRVLAIYHADGKIYGTFFTVKKTGRRSER